MDNLIKSYEQQYSILTADITAKIGRLKVGHDGDNENLTKEIQNNFEDANELLEQLELEVRGIGESGKGEGSRVAAYRAELQRIRDEYRLVTNANSNGYSEQEEVYEDWGGEAEHRQKLLNNTQRLDRSGKALSEGYRIAIETEQIGATVLQDLSVQRETIQRSRGRIRETDEQLHRSSRLLHNMMTRALRDRFVMVAFFIILGVVMCAGLYFYVT